MALGEPRVAHDNYYVGDVPSYPYPWSPGQPYDWRQYPGPRVYPSTTTTIQKAPRLPRTAAERHEELVSLLRQLITTMGGIPQPQYRGDLTWTN